MLLINDTLDWKNTHLYHFNMYRNWNTHTHKRNRIISIILISKQFYWTKNKEEEKIKQK